MKNKLAALMLSFFLPLCLTACVHFPADSNITVTDALETSEDKNTAAEETTVYITLSTPETTETSETPKTSETSEAPVSPAPVPIPENFKISDYITDFDIVQPSKYILFDTDEYQNSDEAAENAAIEAYKNSFYYENALEDIKFLFHYENGVLTPNEENRGALFLDTYQYLTAPEFEIVPKVVQSFKGKFDGENEEHLILLCVPLPPDYWSWSGTAVFFIPVYVNSGGEAIILDDACSQDHSGFECVYYNDSGAIHAILNFGHNEGAAAGAIYSFADGRPKLEVRFRPVWCMDGFKENGLFLYSGWGFFAPFFFNGETREYCALKGVEPNRDLAEIICTNDKILEKVPNAREEYENGHLWIVGGKYITFLHYSKSAFEYKDGEFTETVGYKYDSEIKIYIIPTDKVASELEHALNVEITP